MQVQAINSSEPSFGHIYVPKRSTLSEAQMKILNGIVNDLCKPAAKYKNKSAVRYYEKRGIDFNLKGCKGIPDSIYLETFKGMKFKQVDGEDVFTFKENLMIGIYHEKNPFKTDDIESAIDASKEIRMPYAVPVFAGIVALFAVLGTKLSDKSKQVTKPLIEVVDSVSDKAKTVLPDSVKTKVIKAVK